MNKYSYYKKLIAVKYKDINVMKKLCEQNKYNSTLKFEYAKLLLSSGEDHYDEAKEVLIQLLDTKNKKYAMLELGKLATKQGNINEAKKYYEEMLSKWEDFYARLELGKIEYVLGNYAKAKINLEKVLEEKNEPLVVFQLAKTEKKLGNFSKARIYFKALSKTILNTTIRPHALLELGRLEAEDGNIEEARRILKDLTINQSDEYAYSLLSILEYRSGNYLEAVKIINEELKNNKLIDDKLILALSKKLNIFFNVDYDKLVLTYRNSQILDYNEELAIKHIIDRHVNGEDDFNFNKNIDIYELFNEAKTMLAPENKVRNLVFNDIYIIPYDNIGENDEEYLKVVTLPNSKNIITMYPMFTEYDMDREDSIELNKKLVKKIKNIQKKVI